MPRFYRYPYRRYRRSGGRYWRRSWWRRSVSRAQKQGTRRFSVSIPVEGSASLSVPAGSINSVTGGFQPFFNTTRAAGTPTRSHVLGTLVGNNLFSTYCNLYDEVKLNSFYVEIAVTGLPESKQAVKVVSCVDRHCTQHDIDTEYTLANMLGSAECDSKMFTSLNYSKVSRYFRARDKQERDVFVDSSLGTVNITTPGSLIQYQNAGILEFLENGNLYGALNPLMYLGFVVSSSPAADSTVSFQYRVVWNLTFRNPKYGSSGDARSVGDFKGDVGDDVKGVVEVLPDVVEDEKSVAPKFDDLSDEQKAKIMELMGSMEDEKGA